MVKKYAPLLAIILFALLIMPACRKHCCPTFLPTACFSCDSTILLGAADTFSNCSQHYTYLVWNFGDGSISGDSNPVHLFTDTGVFRVTLLAYNEDGKADSIKQNVTVARPLASSLDFAGIWNGSDQCSKSGLSNYSIIIGADGPFDINIYNLHNLHQTLRAHIADYTATIDGKTFTDSAGSYLLSGSLSISHDYTSLVTTTSITRFSYRDGCNGTFVK